jgi:hypothetical protein
MMSIVLPYFQIMNGFFCRNEEAATKKVAAHVAGTKNEHLGSSGDLPTIRIYCENADQGRHGTGVARRIGCS